MTEEQERLRIEARRYVEECVADGILREIESPLGMRAEWRKAFGERATFVEVVGPEWVAELVRSKS